MIGLKHYLIFGAVLFSVGAVCAAVRKSIVFVFVAVAIMFSASCAVVLAFSRWNLLPQGKALALVFMVLLVVEVLTGFSFYMKSHSTDRGG